MKYFKHSELTEKYHVSLKTVHNWIDAAKQGKVSLKLHTTPSNRTYVADTPNNTLVLKQLAEKGKKFRNSLHHKIIHPKPEFYEIFSHRQVLDIITNLDVHKELPKQYDYLEQGAVNWDNWIKRLVSSEAGDRQLNGTVNGSLELIHVNMQAIDRLLEAGKRINLVDLGVGNAYPVRELLGHLLEQGKLHRYIALDISQSMLTIAERNTKEWFGEDFPFEGYVRDITHEYFDDLLVDDMLDNQAEETINVVLILGSTPVNFPSFDSIFKTAYSSIGSKDLMFFTAKPDSEASRRYFDFNSDAGASNLSSNDQNGYALDLLNISDAFYDVERGFDKELRMRYIRVRLKTSVTIKFDFDNIQRSVSLEKGETILLHRMWHRTALEMISDFEKIGFTLLQSSLTKDRQYFLSICGVEVKQSQGEE